MERIRNWRSPRQAYRSFVPLTAEQEQLGLKEWLDERLWRFFTTNSRINYNAGSDSNGR